MRFVRLPLSIALSAALLGSAICFAPEAHAQAAVKIAVVNQITIFNGLQETKDLNAKLEADRATLSAQNEQKKANIRSMMTNRDALKPDAQQYKDLNKQIMQATVEYEVWTKVTDSDTQRQRKTYLNDLFAKIHAATAEVAAAKGIDLVLAEQNPEATPQDIEQRDVSQIQGMLLQRNMLFVKPGLDISQDVIALMDKQYKK